MRRLIGLVVAVGLISGLAPARAGAAWRPTEDRPRVRVDVATELLDGQVLHARGDGLIPGEPVAFLNCAGTGACFRGSTGVRGVADRRGRVTADVPVQRYRNDYMDDFPVDCAYSRCTLRIVRTGNYEDGYADRASTLVSFARVPTTSPTAVLAPPSLLPPVATVSIAARGFVPGARVEYECLRTTCQGTDQLIYADQSGAATVTLTVTRRARDFRDCVVTGDCAVTVHADSRNGTTVPLSFDPSVPLPLPSLTVFPDTVRTTTGIVGVRVANADPGDRLQVMECATVDRSDIRCGQVTNVVADPDGSAVTLVAVSRFLTQRWGTGSVDYYGRLVDCTTVACTIRVTRDGWYFPLTTMPVHFVAEASLPTIRMRNAVVREGGPGTRPVRLTATLDRPADSVVSFAWRTDSDSVSHAVTIPAGATGASFDVPISGNDQDDPSRTVVVQLTTIDGAQPDVRYPGARIRVIDDDPMPTLDVGAALVSENAGGVLVPVHLSSPTGRRIEFTYRTIGASAQPAEDYVEQVGVVDYPWGDLQIWIPIVDDARAEPVEHFELEIVAVRGARLGNRRADVWIGDDDA